MAVIPEGFPRELLKEPADVRLAYFRNQMIGHPRAKEVRDAVLSAIDQPDSNPLVIVAGPSGVGKTTVAQSIEKALIDRLRPELERDRGRLAVASFEALAPELGNFSWRDHYYKPLLTSMGEPLVDYKRDLRPEGVRSEAPSHSSLGPRSTGAEYRYAVQQALRYRQPLAVLIDEAQHLAKVASGKNLQDQLDVIKSIANLTKTVHVLIGTYELLPFRNRSGQLARRSSNDIHFPRYRLENANDRDIFINVLRSFARLLPLEEPPELTREWEYLYQYSLGCVGVLKQWLDRTLADVYQQGRLTLSRRDLEKHAHSVSKCMKMVEEAKTGEDILAKGEGEDARSNLRSALGLPAGPDANVVAPPVEAADPAKPQRKPRVGDRSPKRDAIGEGARLVPTLSD